eukprot:NODE_1093_length_2134_cov_85.591745_g926_i0.p1 GENE.NODE_1093_length_2134_cov_85.591745_g926_i0~~NODE_1093_length_2134_cov_85.591745_g926_i0.p1  ORF type:complete len:550 (-),score=104.94 NODE_1093_length_2134_cov_85.591745_g926_i0:417-2066(-)
MPPKFVSCYLCGQQYGLSSLPIHQQSCYKKRISEWEQRPKATRGPPPTHPSQVPNHGIAPTQKQNTHQGASGASTTPVVQTAIVGGLVPCEYCGRTFNGDRIEKHMEACKKSQNSKRSKFNSSKQRIKGTELENLVIPSNEPDTSSGQIDWKSQRRDFLSNIRVAKKTQDFEHEFEVYVPSSKPQPPSNYQNEKNRNENPTFQGKRPPYNNAPKNDGYYDNADTSSSNGLSTAPSVGSSAYRSSSSVAQYTSKPRQVSQQENDVPSTKRNTPLTQQNDQSEVETRPNRPPATRRPDPAQRIDERQERPNKAQPPATRRTSRERMPQDNYRPNNYETAQREPNRERYERSDRNERNERNERNYTQQRYEEPEQEEVDEDEDEEFINSDPYTAKLYAEYLASKRTRQGSYQNRERTTDSRGTKPQGYSYTNTRPTGRSENRDYQYDENSDSRASYSRRSVGEPRRLDSRDDYRAKPISRSGREYDEPRHERSYHEDEDDNWEDGSLSHRSYSSHSSQYRSGSIHSDSRSYGASSARRREPQEVRDNYYYRR